MKPAFRYALLLITLSSCHKCNDDQYAPTGGLPPLTDTGAQTFGCKVDGKIFLPHKYWLATGRPLWGTLYYTSSGSGNLVISAYNTDDDLQVWLVLDSVSPQAGQQYRLGKPRGRAWVQRGETYYVTREAQAEGELQVRRFDSTTRVLSGTFWFDGVDTATGSRVKATEGRFDLLLR